MHPLNIALILSKIDVDKENVEETIEFFLP